MMFFGGGMGILWIAIIGLVVWGVIALFRNEGHFSGLTTRTNPVNIAEDRYASGEITREELEKIKQNIS